MNKMKKRVVACFVIVIMAMTLLPTLSYAEEGKSIGEEQNVDSTKIDVSGKKEWDDANNQDGIRPESITINLLENGEKVDSKEIKPDEKGNWEWTFQDLDRYKDGKEIKYTITEEKVKGYETKIEDYNVINTHIPEKIVVKGVKTWKDADDQDGIRPENIKISLYADGKLKDTKKVTAKDKWNYSFKNLDKYKDGKEIKYTIAEEKVKGYVTKIDGYNVTNTHNVNKITVKGSNTWKDSNDQDGIRPKSIKVKLYANGKLKDTKKVTAKDKWSYSFKNLDQYSKGKAIKYTVDEEKIKGYTKKVSGYNLTNTHKVSKVNIPVTKVWNDQNDKNHARPSSVKVKLLADKKSTGLTLTLSKKNKWKSTFKNLPANSKGKAITYTVAEENVKGYTASITGNAKSGYTIKNSYKTALTTKQNTTGNTTKTNTLKKNTSSTPKTGDTNQMGIWIVMLVAACVALVLLFKTKKDK
ncbi:MAG: Cna B-type domain-containing protein [Lachnospiraceae bacterium]|nr:Cna B-type domain-containing protein [Lachnospiraceae bacterium]